MRSVSRQFKRSPASKLSASLVCNATNPALYPSSRFVSSKSFPLKHAVRAIQTAHNIKPAFPEKIEERQRRNNARPNIFRYLVGSIVVLGCGGVAYANHKRGLNKNTIFDPPRFTPFQIVNREEISPTTIVLTVRPLNQTTNISTDPYEKWWKGGTWSVEVKQPQLQIARSYTPLPPREGDRDGDLRFLIRRERNGEVSGYLHRLPVGGVVDLRGPVAEMDVPSDVKEVVFLAGGTGIAPAIQVVHTLLERSEVGDALPQIRIAWANRRREDCVGGHPDVTQSTTQPGYVVRELQRLQNKYPENLKVQYLVDEEGTFLDQKRVSKLTKVDSEVKYGSVTTRIDSRLLALSGPEGFISYFAGPKKWEGGKEGQGEIGGVIGAMRLREWKVWKL